MYIRSHDVPVVYVDSSFAGSGKDVRLRSHTGIVIMMNGAPINARSVLQKITADSSCYAETIALHSAVKETMAMRNLFEKLQMKLTEPTLVLEDNSATISIMGLSSNSSKCRHFLIKYFYAKDLQDQGHILITKVNTLYQLADPMTKQLPEDQLVFLLAFLRGNSAHASS